MGNEKMETETEAFSKIANCLEMGFEFSEIAAVLGWSEDQVAEVEGSEVFRAFKSNRILERFEEEELVGDAWGTIEGKALTIVAQKLMVTKDADFALKAAVMANKAVRRGKGNGNSPIVINGDVRTAVTLPVAFVQQIKAGVIAMARPSMEKKQVDVPRVARVEEILGEGRADVAPQDEFQEMFGNRSPALSMAE